MSKHAVNEGWKIFTVAGGFYFFGKQIEAPEGFVGMEEGAMFGGFSGGKGLPGVARGDSAAKVTLDKIEGQAFFPLSAVYALIDCIDLHKFQGSTWR